MYNSRLWGGILALCIFTGRNSISATGVLITNKTVGHLNKTWKKRQLLLVEETNDSAHWFLNAIINFISFQWCIWSTPNVNQTCSCVRGVAWDEGCCYPGCDNCPSHDRFCAIINFFNSTHGQQNDFWVLWSIFGQSACHIMIFATSNSFLSRHCLIPFLLSFCPEYALEIVIDCFVNTLWVCCISFSVYHYICQVWLGGEKYMPMELWKYYPASNKL